MNGNNDSEQTKEVAMLRREMDRSHQERLAHLETKLDELNSWVRSELLDLDIRLERNLEKSELSLIDRAAQKAVKQAFSHLGVDVDSPTDLQRFRDDLRFGGVFRAAATKSFFALVAAIFGGIGLSLWMAFRDNFGFK